jgi:hypothetical protein
MDEDKAEVSRSGVDPNSTDRNANLCRVLTQDMSSELKKPMGPSDRGQWYDVEAGCSKELTPGLEPEGQQGSVVSTPTTTMTTLPTIP